MVRASKGSRAGTRHKLKKAFRSKFKVTPYIRAFEEGQKVVLSPDPASHKGMPHFRFKGLTGTIKGKRGDSYLVCVKIGNKEKTIISRPEHLRPTG